MGGEEDRRFPGTFTRDDEFHSTRGRGKLFPRDEERKKGGEWREREGALKRGVAAVSLASDISA